MMEKVLQVKNLKVAYGPIKALKGIDLEVRQGETVAIIGANGAGKSTLLKTISGLLKPAEGTIEFRGQPLTSMAPHHIVSKGLIHVPEGRAVLGRMTVEDNLLMGAYCRKDEKEIQEDLEKVLALFPILKERFKFQAGNLSGGQQQMLAIGRGMMARPQIMMLDEPSLGLAPIVIKEIFEIIKNLRDKGITVLLVEQNAKQALKVADRGYVLETGRVVLSDSGANLLRSEEVTRAYLGERKDDTRRALTA
ncbi:ABC transporter ATP-binding protein [Heliorestis convoluta]|uniref:Branched chain amino acid ABC transporter, ATP-binding protein n=1 Tax=Heliorestis convoluta TaxID=356322 RepID=A0A5Q2N1F9_9FIRM|nr:ABC transporter ATP-binding protein [Heliorestis convoluta]QGG47426.1 Branched chain amino acid ABC transporter, ATP-binding protein [Heliorestis convoluta]